MRSGKVRPRFSASIQGPTYPRPRRLHPISRCSPRFPVMLEVDGLRRAFGTVVALDGMSFTVPKGQVVGFLGPNGAGKTTAMRTILGISEPDAGTVLWDRAPVGLTERCRF